MSHVVKRIARTAPRFGQDSAGKDSTVSQSSEEEEVVRRLRVRGPCDI